MESKIVYMTNDHRRYAAMRETCAELQDARRISDFSMAVKLERSSEWNYVWERKLADARLVVVRFINNIFRSPFWQSCRAFLSARGISFVVDSVEQATEERGEGIPEEAAARIRHYSFYGGADNFRAFWLFATSLFDGKAEAAPEPMPRPWAGIYHPELPDGYTEDLADYEARFMKPDRPTLGLLFYRDEWIWDDLAYPAAFIREAEAQGLNALAVFSNQLPDTGVGMPSMREVFGRYFKKEGRPTIDALVTTMKFSQVGNGNFTTDELAGLGVPILAGYTLLSPEADWRANPEGLGAVETSIGAALPELDGTIHGVPIAGRIAAADGAVSYEPMPERMKAMVKKAAAWARLRRKENARKKIALIFHNYPPKNYNIGSASGLDTMESARRLLERMKAEGYTLDFVPGSAAELIKLMTSHATNDLALLTDKQAEECQKLPAKDYAAFFASLPEAAREQMAGQWGEPPGSIMLSDEGNILVPGTMDGNVFLTVQPARQYGMDPSRAYHDPSIAPTHQYIAFYYWLREVFRADAVIHLGTHGNLEWLPGKAVGLDEGSFPDIALGSLPNIYPYLMTISGEGIIAKRRSSACLVGYLPAPMEDAGAFDEIAEIEKLADEYGHFSGDAEQAGALEQKIRELAKKAELDDSVPYDETKPFADYLSELHVYIEDLQDSEVHVGLHVLGEAPGGDTLVNEILHLLRLSNGKTKAIAELWAEKYGLALAELQKAPSSRFGEAGRTGAELLAEIRRETRAFVDTIVKGGFSAEASRKALADDAVTVGPEAWRTELARVASFITDEIAPRLSRTKEELDHVLSALSGGYVPPGPSGSPSAGGVDLLPSGRNFYGADPRALPSQAGWITGVKLGDRMIEKYITDRGHYPETVGMVLWSGPNMRSSGQDIAEFLYLLGVRPTWQKGSLRVTGLEVIPQAELNRPRIDVTARISGLFRDTLPQLAELMDSAVLMVAALDEPDEENFVRKHIREDSAEFMAKGTKADDAWRAAAFRVFGNAPGTYGSGINVVLDAKNWETEQDLAEVYVRWGGHAFGGGARGVFRPELFRKRLAGVELSVKNEESHDMNILSSDDYNGFHGGMINAVKSLGGREPVSYVGNSANRGAPTMRTVAEEMRRIVRTESLNPKYIEGLMQHGYKGAMDMANRLSISYQWDATSGVMEDWMYEDYARKYAFDPKVQQWMKEVNPWALQNIAETLLEAEQRKLWDAKDETLDKLRELYLSVEGELEDEGEE
ncbi:MAG: cobaltochelatase subunit CobN [Schwartzia sp.]|nr:cobaltochelatase subunit CobN [Schwartzia sp. (in: firmicutes)]